MAQRVRQDEIARRVRAKIVNNRIRRLKSRYKVEGRSPQERCGSEWLPALCSSIVGQALFFLLYHLIHLLQQIRTVVRKFPRE